MSSLRNIGTVYITAGHSIEPHKNRCDGIAVLFGIENYFGFEILTALTMKSTIHWDVTPNILIFSEVSEECAKGKLVLIVLTCSSGSFFDPED
jgi:hypothetical protein